LMKQFGLGIMILLFLMSCSQHKKSEDTLKWLLRGVTNVWSK
jgi:hypothetical protein